MRILNIYYKDAKNAGDLKSSPLGYFRFEAEQDSVDLREIGKGFDLSPYDGVIIGGGGLLADYFMQFLTQTGKTRRGKLIVWGAGLNNHFHSHTLCFAPSLAARQRWYWEGVLRKILGKHSPRTLVPAMPPPNDDPISRQRLVWLKTCDLAGIRDYVTEFDWVPCPSCMDGRLDFHRKVTPKHALVTIDHPDYCRIELKGVPHFSNLNNDFESILAFLASGETVLSSSYHATYWAMLLGRKVIVVPWSEKFLTFKHPVSVCFKVGELRACMAQARAFPEALDECRQQNRDFAARAAKLLGLNPPSLIISQTDEPRAMTPALK